MAADFVLERAIYGVAIELAGTSNADRRELFVARVVDLLDHDSSFPPSATRAEAGRMSDGSFHRTRNVEARLVSELAESQLTITVRHALFTRGWHNWYGPYK